MSIANSPYQTMTLKGTNLTPIKSAIENAWASKALSEVEENFPLLTIVRNQGLINDIPVFNHPLLMTLGGQEHVVMDLRYYTRQTVDAQVVVKHPSDYQLAILRAGLTTQWIKESPKMLLGSLTVVMGCFADWIAATLTSRLTPQEYVTASVLSAFFYYSQFQDTDRPTPAELMHVAGSIGRYLRYPVAQVASIIEDLPYIQSIDEFCTVLKEQTQSTRLKDLNGGLLVTMLLNSWFGINHKEIVAAAIEHPPSFIALTAMALASRLHRKTKIAVSVNRVIKAQEGALVLRNIMGIANFDAINNAALHR